MKQFIFILIFGIQFLFAQEFYPNRLLISVKPQSAAWQTGTVQKLQGKVSSAANNLFRKYHVLKIERWLKSADENDVYKGVDFSKIYRLYLQKSAFLNEAQKAFGTLASVRLAEKEPIIKIAASIPPTTPNDPFFDRQWYLKRIMANYAWSLSAKMPKDAPPVLIGIVDTGIDYLHPDIGPALYVNPGEDINGDGQVTESDYNGIDDDNNGFVDDLLGWDFSMASDSSNGDNDIRPPAAGSHEILSHGTHVAGIAGAIPNNEIGISGIARHYKIIGTKQSKDDDYKNGYLYNAYDGVLYAAKLGANVINCSWGSSYFSQDEQDLVNMVSQKYGAIIVAAAGNDNSNNDNKHFYPSDLNNVITVAALDPSDHKASFSNYGHVIDISAPGQSIFSTIHYYKGGYASWAGTSMASPVVAGSFALLKAFFPELPRDSLIERLLQGADPLNTGYHHLLGSGRVNVYNAIAPQFLPGLRITDDSLTLKDQNGNGQVDPGETIHLSLSVENRANWQDAHQVQITAHCSDSLVTLVDSVAFLGNVSAGSKKSTDPQDFTLIIGKAHAYGSFTVKFNMTCNPDSELSFNEHYSLPVLLSTYQQGFPWQTNGSLLPVSLMHSNKKNKNFIVFISHDYNLYLLDASGKVAKNFPVDLLEYHRVPPVIVDVDGDGEPEIITASQHGKIKAITTNGSLLWQTDIGQTIYGNVAAGDLDGDGKPEIVLATMQKQLHVLGSDGKEWPGFPVNVGSFVDKGIALADVNNDSIPEIIFGTFDRKLHCMNNKAQELPGWPVELNSGSSFTPVIGEDMQGIHIFIADREKRLHVFNGYGQTELDTLLNTAMTSQPALGDADGNGKVDLLATFDDGTIRLISVSGSIQILKSLQADVNFDVSPLFIKAGEKERLVALSSKGQVSAFNEKMDELSFSPIFLEQPIISIPAIGDLDGDGDLEVLSANSNSVAAIDLPDSLPDNYGWSTYMGNNRRTGFLKVQKPTGLNSEVPAFLPKRTDLKVFPNPFNSTTKIEFSLSHVNPGRSLNVNVYDVRGRRVFSLFNGTAKQRTYRLHWRGQNQQGKIVSSGIYFIVIHYQNKVFGRQVLLIK